MSATLLDGRLVSDLALTEVSKSVMKLKKTGIHPKLVIIRVGEDAASIAYIRQKHKAADRVGILYEELHFDDSLTTERLIEVIQKLNVDITVHGILVQLPLPQHIQVPLIIRAIDPKKDVDGFHAYNLGKLFLAREFEHLAPCTPQGVIKLLEHYKISVAGKYAVIVGRSNIVGKPLAIMLLNRDATVTIAHSKTRNLAPLTREADILIAAVGKPGLIQEQMVKPGAIVVDVGITKVENKLVGDVDFEHVRNRATYITPVPGGVGPMTVACLMENVVRAASVPEPSNP